ncbi:MAG: thioredoxin-disulfide reductase [Proteobacteria bacterium]|nr:thioredoxin-disulfide reductase [Pseudomonadota bacterium]
MTTTPHSPVAIIGTGPAGYTAALYTARAELAPVVIDGLQPGGQLTTTTEVENYPGFPQGIQGPDMMELLRQQALRFGAQYVGGVVDRVDFGQRPFQLYVDGQARSADAVIICTGASAKYLGLESERRLLGHGVSACATCDGFFYRGKEVAVVGGGDTALEEALFLTRFATKVTLIHRRDELRGSKIMRKRALDHPKIAPRWNTVVSEVLGDPAQGGLRGLRLKDVQTGAESELPCNGLFVAIGHQPNTQPFIDWLETDELGYLKVQAGSARTAIPGVFAAGDVIDRVYRQAITAAGMGCMAAIDCERWLAEHAG